jgi:sensor histidine kinase regulating citrate/malate metabolism
MKIDPSKRFIKIHSKVNQGWTVFIVENAYNGHLKKTGQRIFTSKQDTKLHGNGLKIVRELVEKRGGIMTVDAGQTEKIFTVKMTIKHK